MSDRTSTPHPAAPARPSWKYAALVLIPICLAYLTSFQGAFVFDDIRHIVNNDQIKDLANLPEMFTSRRPVVTLSLALNHAIGGLDTAGYHALNLLVHLAAAFVLFDLVRRTLLLERFGDRFFASAAPIAAACALLWGIHPLTTQAVTYIIQRGESIASLCYLLVLYSLVRAVGARVAANWLALGVVACAVGLGSKAIVATAPVLALLFDRVFLSGSMVRAIRLRWPFYLALAATWGLLLVNGLFASIFLTEAGEKSINNIGFGMKGVHVFEYTITQPGVVWHYLRLVFVPIGQVIDDRLPFAESLSPMIILQGGALALAALAGLFGTLKGRVWGFLLLAFFVILAPTSSFVPIRDAAYEHRMYLPLAAVIIAAVCAAHAYFPAVRSRAGLAVVSVIALVLAGLTASRNLDYTSRLSIWQDTLEKRPHNDRAMINVAMQLAEPEGDTEPDYPGAIEHFERALEIKPGNTLALRWLAIAQAKSGDTDAAQRSIRSALQGGFQTPFEYARFGQRLLDLGEKSLYAQAVTVMEVATLRNPTNAEWRLGLAEAQRRSGDSEAAAITTQEVAAVLPEDPQLLLNMANDLQTSGNTEGAIENYRKILDIDPANLGASVKLAEILLGQEDQQDGARALLLATIERHAQTPDAYLSGAYFVLGRVEEAAGDDNAAITTYIQAIEGDDQFVEPVINVGNLLEKHLRSARAIDYYEAARVSVVPTDENVLLLRSLLSNYGNCLCRAGRFIDAMPIYEQAIDLAPGDPMPLRGYAYAQWQAGLLQDAMDTCNEILQIVERDPTTIAYVRSIAAELAASKHENTPPTP